MANLSKQNPKKIGNYKVLGELGRGGMGIVYRASDSKSGKLCALKMIPPEALTRPDSALRFKREFRAMQRVEHPNVIRVFESGTHGGSPFFTMELVDGRDIRTWLDGDPPIVPISKGPPPSGALKKDQRLRLNDPTRIRRMTEAVVQVGFALGAIHSHRIVHRDLKPDNILVSKAGMVKLMDFGISKQLGGPTEHSSGGMVVGTFKYLSPEQALGADVDGRADLYCLGIILYELLAGRHPFFSETSVGYAYHHARTAPPTIDQFNPEVDPNLRGICERLISKDPNERHATAEDLIVDLREAVEGIDVRSQKMRPVDKKGKDLPFQLTHDQLFQPALVGRNTELGQLTALCDALLEGKPRILAITGPSDSGKTRLVREAVAVARSRGVDLLISEAIADGAVPYQPYVDALERILDGAKSLSAPEVKRLLGPEGRVLARYLPGMKRWPPSIQPKPAAALGPREERRRFLSAVSSFLGRYAAARPPILCIDDLHHAGELSLDLTRHLAHTMMESGSPGDGESAMVAPICLVLTLDPESDQSDGARNLLTDLAQLPGFMTVGLNPLAPRDVRDLLATMIGGGAVASAIGEVLHQETGGLPGAVEAQVRAWAESGKLRRKGRTWVLSKRSVKPPSGGRRKKRSSRSEPKERVTSVDAKRPPGMADDSDEDSVAVGEATRADIPILELNQDVAKRRVERLTAIARDVAERAAVGGERIPATLLQTVALRPEDEFIDAVDELLKVNVFVESDEEEGFYRFAGKEERRALLKRIQIDRKKRLHLLVARAMQEENRRWQRAIHPEVLARQYLDGGEPFMALDHLMAAARMSLEASATQTAAQRVREAHELFLRNAASREYDPAIARRDLELILLRLDVLAAVGEHKECVALATRRLPKLRGRAGARQIAEVILRLAESERVVGDLENALAHVAEVLSITERGGAHNLRCRAKRVCGQIYAQRGQFDRSITYFKEALELARTIGDAMEAESARYAMARRALEAGKFADAERDFKSLLEAAETRGEQLRIAAYLIALGRIHLERGDDVEAETLFRRSIDLAKPAGDRRGVAVGLSMIGDLRLHQGRPGDALSLFSKAARILSDTGDVEQLARIRLLETITHLEKDDESAARKKGAEAIELAGQAKAGLLEAEAQILNGWAQARGKMIRQAQASIGKGLSSALAIGAEPVVVVGLCAKAELEMQIGEEERALDALKKARARARRLGSKRLAGRVDRTEEVVERLSGR
jgi:serine/threonine protein kinase/tetratricopeptide (TPR) repeat protein